MKLLTTAAISAMIALQASADSALVFPQLPAGTLPDTEVATNVAMSVDTEKLREFSLSIAASNITSNEVIVAVGCDENNDGDMSLDEAAFAFGYDCGTRYFVDYGAQSVAEGVGETIKINRKQFDPRWNLAKIVKRGLGDVGESVTETVETVKFVIKLR